MDKSFITDIKNTIEINFEEWVDYLKGCNLTEDHKYYMEVVIYKSESTNEWGYAISGSPFECNSENLPPLEMLTIEESSTIKDVFNQIDNLIA